MVDRIDSLRRHMLMTAVVAGSLLAAARPSIAQSLDVQPAASTPDWHTNNDMAKVHSHTNNDGTDSRPIASEPDAEPVGRTAPQRLPGDVTGDGCVEVGDLVAVLSSWGDAAAAGDMAADVDADGRVDMADLLLVLGEWGQCAEGQVTIE